MNIWKTISLNNYSSLWSIDDVVYVVCVCVLDLWWYGNLSEKKNLWWYRKFCSLHLLSFITFYPLLLDIAANICLFHFHLFSSYSAQNNYYTRHLAKILIHLGKCLQECISTSGVPSTVYTKAVNAVYISSVFLKYLIENAKSENIEELHLSLDESEVIQNNFPAGNSHATYNPLRHILHGSFGTKVGYYIFEIVEASSVCVTS